MIKDNGFDKRIWLKRDLYGCLRRGKENIKISKKVLKLVKKFDKFVDENRFYIVMLFSMCSFEKVNNKYNLVFDFRESLDLDGVFEVFKKYYEY